MRVKYKYNIVIYSL